MHIIDVYANTHTTRADVRVRRQTAVVASSQPFPGQDMPTVFGRNVVLTHSLEHSGGLCSLDMSEFYPTDYAIKGENGYQLFGHHHRDRPCCRLVTDWCPAWCPLFPLLQWSTLTGSNGKLSWEFTIDMTPQHEARNACVLCECCGMYNHTEIREKDVLRGAIRHTPLLQRLMNLLYALLCCASAVSAAARKVGLTLCTLLFVHEPAAASVLSKYCAKIDAPVTRPSLVSA